jgi:hypothetical protein
MNTYDPKKDGERRSMGDFEREVIGFMGEIRQYMRDQRGRCDSHSADIKSNSARIVEVERAIEFKSDDEHPISKRVSAMETAHANYGWLYAWIGAAWASIVALGTWIFGHAAANHESVRQSAEAIKKIKGG